MDEAEFHVQRVSKKQKKKNLTGTQPPPLLD